MTTFAERQRRKGARLGLDGAALHGSEIEQMAVDAARLPELLRRIEELEDGRAALYSIAFEEGVKAGYRQGELHGVGWALGFAATEAGRQEAVARFVAMLDPLREPEA